MELIKEMLYENKLDVDEIEVNKEKPSGSDLRDQRRDIVA